MTSDSGPDEPVDKTSSKGKGRAEGTPEKNKGFKGTPKKLIMDVHIVPRILMDNQRNRNIPLGLENKSSVCFSILLFKLYSCCHLFEIMLNTSLLTGPAMLMLCQI